MQPCFYIICL
uniref:Uncharacterized protein n=1 Tax=Lepeophtheirus salmonis TaxID=72036 RepID=A0A0K2U775_LEPSM